MVALAACGGGVARAPQADPPEAETAARTSFEEAERARRETVERIPFPVYKGPNDRDSVLEHVRTKVAAWANEKKDAILDVEPLYGKVAATPHAPRQLVVDASSRVGGMWGTFVDEFRLAPIPDAWKDDVEIRGIYYDALDATSEPIQRDHARPAMVHCLRVMADLQYGDDLSFGCERWLATHYKAEYHLTDEIQPGLVTPSGLGERPPPLAR
jgi:hypothetical protein